VAVIGEPRESHPVSLLVVDDDRDVREIIGQVLEAFGFRVVVARDAASALEHAGAESFAGVVADLSLPDLPGPTLVDRLREREPDLRAVIMSGYPEDGDRWTSETTRFLPKPFGTAALAQALEELGIRPSSPAFQRAHGPVPESQPA
jgi:CheY-like chemotaxis protein